MHKFERIAIQGYRRLKDVNLPMRELMVMIGANGSGKTSFLKDNETTLYPKESNRSRLGQD